MENIHENEHLQNKFMEIVNEMIEKKVELPDEFRLHYLVACYTDIIGSMIRIDAFLTSEESKKILEERGEYPNGEGKCGWYYHNYYSIIPGYRASTENYDGSECDNRKQVLLK